jgi:hypothetical protein
MANKFTRYLTQNPNGINGVVAGFLRGKGHMSNWQHATRMFVDDTFRLAPRHKFLYYAVFEIDTLAHNATVFTQNHAKEVGLLLKTAELPKFNFDTVTKNQYNRKKLLYKQINYDPVNITMHDDNAGIINSLWAIYYGAYVADRHLPTEAYSALHYRPTGAGAFDNFRYGLDNNKTVDMFKSISLYTMSRSRFNGYTLINPRIQAWNHGSVDYADNGVLESSMTVQYEAVQYSTGNVTINQPKGFATLHYDTTPSPLSLAGGGVATVTGEGGVLSGIESVFGDISKGTINTPGGFLSTAVKAANVYRNASNIKGSAKDVFKREAINILNSPQATRGLLNQVGGIVGSVFPKNNQQSSGVVAKVKKFFGN